MSRKMVHISQVVALFVSWLTCTIAVPAWAQDVTPPPDTYFDFAMHDEDHIYTKGVWPDDAKKVYEQRKLESSDALDTEFLAQSVVDDYVEGEEQNATERDDDFVPTTVFDAPVGAVYRVTDLTLNCDIEFCQSKQNIDALLRATGLSLGRLASTQELALSIERLRKTGYFSNIKQTPVYEGENVRVHFDAVGHQIIRAVRFDVKGALFDSELKKRMILRAGSPLYPRTALLRGHDADAMSREELTKIAIDDQVKSLERLYQKEGYLDAKVTIDVVPVEENPEHVDLIIKVAESHGYGLGKVYVRGHNAFKYSEIESTFRSGFSFFGNATKEQIEDSIEEVLELYRDAGYYQAKIDFVSRLNEQNKTIDVFIDIDEAHKWSVEYKGNAALSTKELNGVLTFRTSGYVDGAEIEASVEALRNLYISAGYYWVKASGEMIKPGNIILFTIDEGPHTEIGSIKFEGAYEIPEDELFGIIDSTEYAAFGNGAYPQRAMIADDAAKIVDAYRERGYLNADVPRWTLEKYPGDTRWTLTFFVNEGQQSVLDHRQIRYTDRAQFDQYEVKIDKPSTNVFSDYALRAESTAITKQLRARGYATIANRPRCVSYASDGTIASLETCEIADYPAECFPEDPAELCQPIDKMQPELGESCTRTYKTWHDEENGKRCQIQDGLLGQIIDVEYEITLGPKYTFGDVFTHGNVVTRDWVVNQDIPIQRDDTFDYNKIMEARTLLRQRTIYNSASLNVIGVDDNLVVKSENADSTGTTEYPVPLVVNLEEARRRWFDFALGLQLTSDDWLLTGEIEFVEANLLGLGWDLRVLLMPEARFLNGSEWVFTQKFNQNFFALLTLTVPLFPSRGLDLVGQLFYDLRYIPETDKEEAGGLVEIQWNIDTNWFAALAFEAKTSVTSSFAFDVSNDLDAYHACYPVTFFMDCPFADDDRSVTLSLTPRAFYDGRDSPLSPKNGFYIEGKLKLAYSDSVGIYAKPDLRASYIFTFLEYFTLGFNLRLGLSFMPQSSTLPLIDRYFLGGLSMRGYDNDALGPRLVNSLTPNVATNEAAGGEALFNFNAELRFPIWNSVGIFAAIFLDTGSIVEHQPTYYDGGDFFREMFVNEMRYTAGLGLRWLINDAIPPIVIDYGFILNRRHGDPLGSFSLNVGYTF